MIRDVFLCHDICLYCMLKTFEGIPGGSTGGGGYCEGINDGWVAQNKIVCMWWQMGVIGRGKGCRDNLSCVRPWCSLRCEEISHRVWNVGARGMFGGTDWCVVTHQDHTQYPHWHFST